MGRNFQRTEDGRIEVYDLDFAAFLSMHNVPLAEAFRDGREFLFKFVDPDNKIKELAIVFANSESAKFADCVRRLKKVTIATAIGR
jgi:hypothetical protein